MKALHFADVHLGSDESGPIDPETGLSARLMDFLKSLDAIVEYIKAEEIDLVLFCGDAYKTRTPTPTLVREFAQRIRLMADLAPVVLVVGNHDLPGAWGKAHTLEIYRTLNVENVYIADRPQLFPIETKSGVVQVVAMPWATRHNLMAQEKVQGLPLDQINELIADAVAQTIEGFARGLTPEQPAILAGHMTVAGGAFGSERSVMLGSDIVIPLEAVALPQFDYVALGHLHRHQMLHDSPPVVYSGSIERIDFGEEKEEKGFMVVEIGREEEGLFDGAYVETEFIPLNVRHFLTIEVSVDGSDPMTAIMEAIDAEKLQEKVVRMVVNSTAEGEALLDKAQIQKALGAAFRLASLTTNVERATRVRLGDMDYREMGPLQLLEAYLESKGKPAEEQEALVKAAEELIKEGEQ